MKVCENCYLISLRVCSGSDYIIKIMRNSAVKPSKILVILVIKLQKREASVVAVVKYIYIYSYTVFSAERES